MVEEEEGNALLGTCYEVFSCRAGILMGLPYLPPHNHTIRPQACLERVEEAALLLQRGILITKPPSFLQIMISVG
jgi:hypothetical protein